MEEKKIITIELKYVLYTVLAIALCVAGTFGYRQFAIKYAVGCWTLIANGKAMVNCEVIDSRTMKYVGSFVPPSIIKMANESKKALPKAKVVSKKKKVVK